MKKVNIYTDGSCLGNPGPGGWSAILELAGANYRKELAGGFRLTTNNRMELLAAINALAALKQPCEVELFTDSQYLSNAVQKGWLHSWRRKNWLKKGNTPVPNADLWQQLLAHFPVHAIRFVWLKGHAGHPQNERCDELAKEWASRKDLPPDVIYEKLRNSGA